MLLHLMHNLWRATIWLVYVVKYQRLWKIMELTSYCDWDKVLCSRWRSENCWIITKWIWRDIIPRKSRSRGGGIATIYKSTLRHLNLVLSQVSSYLNSHKLCNTCQSAYRPGHSTETALQKAVNDLLLSLSIDNISVLALLDLIRFS